MFVVVIIVIVFLWRCFVRPRHYFRLALTCVVVVFFLFCNRNCRYAGASSSFCFFFILSFLFASSRESLCIALMLYAVYLNKTHCVVRTNNERMLWQLPLQTLLNWVSLCLGLYSLPLLQQRLVMCVYIQYMWETGIKPMRERQEFVNKRERVVCAMM